jgi:hypothetical protein
MIHQKIELFQALTMNLNHMRTYESDMTIALVFVQESQRV